MSMGKEKYVNKENKIIHCPKCRGVILKHYQVDADRQNMNMVLKCPHCRENLKVTFTDSSVVVEKSEK